MACPLMPVEIGPIREKAWTIGTSDNVSLSLKNSPVMPIGVAILDVLCQTTCQPECLATFDAFCGTEKRYKQNNSYLGYAHDNTLKFTFYMLALT